MHRGCCPFLLGRACWSASRLCSDIVLACSPCQAPPAHPPIPKFPFCPSRFSCQGALDLRPGLALFASWWLATVAYPEFQDSGGRLGYRDGCMPLSACFLCRLAHPEFQDSGGRRSTVISTGPRRRALQLLQTNLRGARLGQGRRLAALASPCWLAPASPHRDAAPSAMYSARLAKACAGCAPRRASAFPCIKPAPALVPPHCACAAMGAAPRPDLGAYFEDPRVQSFLAAQVGRLRLCIRCDASFFRTAVSPLFLLSAPVLSAPACRLWPRPRARMQALLAASDTPACWS